jgi:glycosyltransferase involved in cell wall biosynthesis
MRWVPRRFFWRLGLSDGYQIEQSTFAWNLMKVLRHERIDILHVQDAGVARHIQRARRMGLVKTRTILAHGTEESFEFLQKIEYLQHLAPWHLEEARAAGVWKPTWTAIPNFIDTEVFRPKVQMTGYGQSSVASADCPVIGSLRAELGIPAEAVVVLCAAAIKRHHKRVDYVVREFAALRGRRPELPVWLVVAGGWEKDTDELIASGRELLGDRVRFLVRFPRERMPHLYRAADLFTLGSLKEMMPIALLEATASGLPCVVNRHPVMEWMIGPGGAAIDIAADGALAREIERLAADCAGRTELGRLAREHCVANFGKAAVVNRILEYYGQVSQGPMSTQGAKLCAGEPRGSNG